MIENLIHTVSTENKPSKFGSLQAGISKSDNNLEGQFRALFKSYNSEPESSENSQSDQDPLNDTDATETEMNGSSDAVKESGIGSGAVINVENEELITQNSKDQKSENQHENRDPVKITVTDTSIVEIENSQNLVVHGPTEKKNANVSESDDQEVAGNTLSNAKNEHTEIQELNKVDTQSGIAGENSILENAQLLDGSNSVNEKFRSENSVKDLIRREPISDLKESLSDSVIKMDGSSSGKSEAENKVDTHVSRYASNTQPLHETDSQKGSKVSVSAESDKPVQNVENTISKQAPSVDPIEKGEPEVLKSNEIRRFINVEDDSNTIRKSGEGTGKTWQSDGSTNQVNNPVNSNEPVSQSDEKVQTKVKDNSLSAGLRNNEVYSGKSLSGESGSERVQPNVRESNGDYTFTTFSNRAILNHGENQNHGETRQSTESPGNVSDRIINENIEKPIRIAHKPIESTVLIQDKIHPKRERNDELLLNNESKESSRLTIPGIGADVTKQGTSFSSGQNSEDFGGLSESDKNELLWKEHVVESVESDELKRSELSAEALTRLGDSTLSNQFLRRVLLPGLTQTVFTASSQSNRTESWQRHNFILEDGSKVQLSARKIDGVLQIKLGATLGELSKLLQIHQNEIREHLEKECNIKIDLQFEQGSGEQDQSSLENFFGESTKKPVFEGGVEVESRANSKIKKQIQAVVTRDFGYNSKEWTA